MELTDTVMVAAATALAPTIVAIGGLIVALRTSKKTEGIASTSDATYHIVNGQTSVLRAELATATVQVTEMKTLLAIANAHIQSLIATSRRAEQPALAE